MGQLASLVLALRIWWFGLALLLLSCSKTPAPVDLEVITRLWSPRAELARQAEADMRQRWSSGDGAAVVELLTFTREPSIRARLIGLLEELSGRRGGDDLDGWWQWVWKQPPPPAYYSELKAILYSRVDPRFGRYFEGQPRHEIRLDELAWGGVVQDGIPPLDHPPRLRAAQADYLSDSDVVFGVSHRGQARAYPKRILAWHELARDRLGEEELTLVYCTLCGSCILYRSGPHVLGTSGFLYRSNKLMFDQKTQSLWSTLEGRPVVGALVGKVQPLEMLSVVTTSWGEWKKLHPQTEVLSLDTGHQRDYGEGVAYREYFAHDRLMFPVSVRDQRLANKDEVLTLRDGQEMLAVPIAELPPESLLPVSLGSHSLLAVHRGGRRVYEVDEHRFQALEAGGLRDVEGGLWRIEEDALVGPSGERLKRFPSHQAFWFGWVAAYPKTRLWTRQRP